MGQAQIKKSSTAPVIATSSTTMYTPIISAPVSTTPTTATHNATETKSEEALTADEKLFLWLCDEGSADISQFISLLDQGIRLNIHDKEGWHPLWHVSYCGRKDLVELFLEHNAEVDLPTADKHAETALMKASTKGHLEITQLLISKGALVNFQSKTGETALYLASGEGNIKLVKLLLQNGARVNLKERPFSSSPLIASCDDKYIQVTQLLISNGADVDYQDNTGTTALHWAANDGHTKVVKLLIHSHAKLNIKNKNGDTPLHYAVENGHTEVVWLLLLSRAIRNIKNNAGRTPLQLAKQKNYSEIITLLKTEVPAPDTASEEEYIELLTGSDELSINEEDDHHSQSVAIPLSEAPKEGYICVAQNSLCLVYLPSQENDVKLSLKTVTDTSIHPKLASYEILITSVVCLTLENVDVGQLSLENPAVIELAKTIELSDEEGNNKVIPLCASSESSEWKELGSEHNCKILKDRISFQTTHFSLYAVISRKPFPSMTVKISPSASTDSEVTVPELPGFKIQIPPSSINTDKDVDITATVRYDCPAFCSEDERSRLASSCIELEPHGITFSKAVSISIPIPHYAEIKKKHPNAQLQIWHIKKCSYSSTTLDRNLVGYSIARDEKGRYVAIIPLKHFCWLTSLWDTVKSLLYAPFGIKERCQVFMSQETRLKPTQDITFSIAVLFYPYKEDPEPVPCNYKYTLLDSGLLDLEVSNNDALQFEVELNEQLLPKKLKPITGSFVISSHQARHQKARMVSMDGKVELQPGLPIGELTFGIKNRPEDTHQTLILMKPIEQTLATEVHVSTLEFENTIMDAARRLRADATQYEHSPLVETAKRIASMWLEMAQLIRRECGFEGKCKEDIVDLAKSINKESEEVVRIATIAAEACTDEIMKNDVCGVVERTETLSHQLRYLATREATRQRDKASALEACQMLTTNAENLTSAISEALYHTQSASLRVSKETREELGLTQPDIRDIIGKLNQCHKVTENRGDQSQESTEESQGYKQSCSISCSTVIEERNHLNSNDLQRVQNSIWEARVQWYNLGLGLDITPDSLDTIKLDNAHKTEDCFRAMLVQWLREQQRPTWRALAQALRCPSVGLAHLAEHILEQHL